MSRSPALAMQATDQQAECGQGVGHVGPDRIRGDAKHLRGAPGVQVEQQPQGNYLPLLGGQPHQGRHDPRIGGAVSGPIAYERFRDHAQVGNRYFPAAAP